MKTATLTSGRKRSRTPTEDPGFGIQGPIRQFPDLRCPLPFWPLAPDVWPLKEKRPDQPSNWSGRVAGKSRMRIQGVASQVGDRHSRRPHRPTRHRPQEQGAVAAPQAFRTKMLTNIAALRSQAATTALSDMRGEQRATAGFCWNMAGTSRWVMVPFGSPVRD